MQTAKICIVGDFAVGKTSTVERYVNNVFSEKYLTTLGVKVDTYVVDDDEYPPIKLVLWDVAGSKRFGQREFAYLRGAAGYMLVVDGTRKPTLESALGLYREIDAAFGSRPSIVLLNKTDLEANWELEDEELGLLAETKLPYVHTSAKSGAGIREAFAQLAREIVSS